MASDHRVISEKALKIRESLSVLTEKSNRMRQNTVKMKEAIASAKTKREQVDLSISRLRKAKEAAGRKKPET